MEESEIRKFIRETYREMFKDNIPKVIEDALVKEFYRCVEEYKGMGFKEDEAEILAKGTIREVIKIGKMRVDVEGI